MYDSFTKHRYIQKNRIPYTLQATQLPDKAIVVTIDVNSFYPSLPQTQCMNIIYDEIHKNRLKFSTTLT